MNNAQAVETRRWHNCTECDYQFARRIGDSDLCGGSEYCRRRRKEKCLDCRAEYYPDTTDEPDSGLCTDCLLCQCDA